MTYWTNDDEDLHEIWPERLNEYIAPVPKESYQRLNPRQRVLYAHERKEFFTWYLDEGKDPNRGEGYAESSLPPTSCRLDQFYRWVWSEFGGFRRNITEDQADAYVVKQLKENDWSNNARRKTLNALAILLRYKDVTVDWETPVYWEDSTSDNPSDFFETDELYAIRNASTEFGSVPSPRSLSEEEIDEWKAVLAQRWGTQKSDITTDDFTRANSWKIPSLVYVSCDIGLRPWEVKDLTLDNLRLDQNKVVIPKDQSAKNSDVWNNCTLTDQTVDIVRRWKKERAKYDMYADPDEDAEAYEDAEYPYHIWLTKNENRYEKQSLRDLMIRLMDQAGIDADGREKGWYLIRRGVATHIANQEHTTLQDVMEQLRIKRAETAGRYIRSDTDMMKEKVLLK